jgi:hypothetical protein
MHPSALEESMQEFVADIRRRMLVETVGTKNDCLETHRRYYPMTRLASCFASDLRAFYAQSADICT